MRFAFEGVNRKGEPDHRDERAQANFIARPADRDWRDYRIVMWQRYPVEQWSTLKSMGIDAGHHVGRNQPPPEFLAGSDLQWYAENIATDFYSEYHRYFPDRPVQWKFTNFSACAGHNEWLDIAYARALQMDADAIHSAKNGLAWNQFDGAGGHRISEAVGRLDCKGLLPRTPVTSPSK